MFIDFLADAFGDMFNQMCKLQWMSSGRLKMPIVVRGCVGAAQSNAAHHSGNYYPFFMHIPGFRVVMPTTPADAKGLLKTAIRSDDPVLFLEHKNLLALKGPVPDGEYLIPFGQAAVRRAGSDLTIVGIGFTVKQALDAAEQLAAEGVSAEVIDPRTLAPLDMDTILASVHKTGRLLVVDEDFAPVRRRRGDRDAGDGGRFRRPGRAGAPRERPVRPRALQPAALRAAGAERQGHRPGRARAAGRVTSNRRLETAATDAKSVCAGRLRKGSSDFQSPGRREDHMPFEVVLPRLGWNMETGRLGEWLKRDGERVEAGETPLHRRGGQGHPGGRGAGQRHPPHPARFAPAGQGSAGRHAAGLPARQQGGDRR